MEEQKKPESWSEFAQQGIALAAVTSIFWVPLFGAIAAVFCDGIFGTHICEKFDKFIKP